MFSWELKLFLTGYIHIYIYITRSLSSVVRYHDQLSKYMSYCRKSLYMDIFLTEETITGTKHAKFITQVTCTFRRSITNKFFLARAIIRTNKILRCDFCVMSQRVKNKKCKWRQWFEAKTRMACRIVKAEKLIPLVVNSLI